MFSSYLVCVPSFKSINSSCLSRNMMGTISLPPSVSDYVATPCKQVSDQNTLVGIGLIEITEPSDTLNYKPFFKHCILKTILHIFLLFIFVWNKIFCPKN